MSNVLDELHIELFEALTIGLAINDMEGNLIYVNHAYANLIGYPKKEVYKLSYWDITPKKYNDQEQIQLELLSKNKAYGPYDKEYIHKTGALIPVRLNGKIITLNGKDYIWSTVEDTRFSKSKEIESDLNSKSKLVEESKNEIFIFDYYSLKFIYLNKAAKKNIGYSDDEIIHLTPLDFKPEFRREDIINILQPLINEELDFVNLETLHQRKDKSTYMADITLQKGFFSGKAVYIAFVWDVTQKKEIEKKQEKTLIELDKLIELQKVLLNTAAYVIISTTTEGVITQFNRTAENTLGYSAGELVGQETPAIFHDFDEVISRSKEFSKILGKEIIPGYQTFTCLADHNLPNEYEWTFIKKDGTRLPTSLSVTCLKDKKGNTTGYLGVAYPLKKS